jgi:hypothetical protein
VENDQTAKIGRQRPPVLPSQLIVTKQQACHGKIIALTTEVVALRDHLLRQVFAQRSARCVRWALARSTENASDVDAWATAALSTAPL